MQGARACVHADFLALENACVRVSAHGASGRRTEPMSADHTQAGIRPSDLNLDEMVALKEIPREERISLLNARLLAKL